jgi:hypothetical protein
VIIRVISGQEEQFVRISRHFYVRSTEIQLVKQFNRASLSDCNREIRSSFSLSRASFNTAAADSKAKPWRQSQAGRQTDVRSAVLLVSVVRKSDLSRISEFHMYKTKAMSFITCDWTIETVLLCIFNRPNFLVSDVTKKRRFVSSVRINSLSATVSPRRNNRSVR